MSDLARPKVKDIISTVREALHQGIEPFNGAYSLVPTRFEILLHPDAYAELSALESRIYEGIRSALDDELARMNRRHPQTVWRSITGFVRQLFSGSVKPAQQKGSYYQRGVERWDVVLLASLDAHVPLGYIGVQAELAAPKSNPASLGGSNPTRRYTQQVRDRALDGKPAFQPVPPTVSQAKSNPVARLSWTVSGEILTFSMIQTEVLVGRFSDENPHVHIRIPTVGDVSREHVHIRYDVANRRFLIKDTSQFGTTVNSRTIRSSMDQVAGTDRDVWEVLPSPARIGLANACFVDFQSLV